MPIAGAFERQQSVHYPQTVIASSDYMNGAPMGIDNSQMANASLSGSSSLDITGQLGIGMLVLMILGVTGFYYFTRNRQL